ncbi:MAG: hypoxanthine phosphoribosyltransferase, partial [Candidatus Atribacteria bacterium]|nr:hypoxanthine phosphoribosyltransferase [Candidatus Atribacteria bacterium]
MSKEEFQLGEVVFSSAEIEEKITELAQRLNQEYAASRPVLICVLKGAVFFTVDLSRKLNFDFDL